MTRMANSNKIKIAYNIHESYEGSNEDLSPIIFLHGMLGSKEWWDTIPQAIADKTKRKIYVCDARDHGESDHPDDFSFELTMNDLLNFMDEMTIPKAILVGHSMGGMTCILAALKKPERVEMVFVIDIFILDVPKEMTDSLTQFTNAFVKAVRNIPKETPESEVRKNVVTALFKDIPENSDMQIEKESTLKSNIVFKRKPDGSYDVSFNGDAIIKFAKEIENKKCMPDGQFAGPAYFLYGTKSSVKVNLQEANIKKQFPEAKLIAFEGATHNLHIQFPDKFIHTLLEFL